MQSVSHAQRMALINQVLNAHPLKKGQDHLVRPHMIILMKPFTNGEPFIEWDLRGNGTPGEVVLGKNDVFFADEFSCGLMRCSFVPATTNSPVLPRTATAYINTYVDPRIHTAAQEEISLRSFYTGLFSMNIEGTLKMSKHDMRQMMNVPITQTNTAGAATNAMNSDSQFYFQSLHGAHKMNGVAELLTARVDFNKTAVTTAISGDANNVNLAVLVLSGVLRANGARAITEGGNR
jgi:hypothetical protein